ncbi:zinc finger, CCHC-type containing protein [Tanacetum coccineum]
MYVAAMNHMASNFAKLDKFEGVDFGRWQKKMYFLISSMSVVYVLTTPIPKDDGDDATVKQSRKRAKWDNDDYVCRGLILNGMSDSLFDIYQNVKSSKELWDFFKAKYMAEDASSKKFFVSNFTNYKMTDSRLVLEQYNELLGILGRFTQHKMNMDEAIQDSDKPKGNNIAGPLVVNMVEHNNSSRYNDNKGKHKIMITQGLILTRRQNLLVGNVTKVVTLKGIEKVLMLAAKLMVQAQRVRWMDDDVAWWVDLGATVHVCKDRCWFKIYELLNDGSILHMGNESTALVHGRGCVDLRVPNKRNRITPYELWTKRKLNLNYLRVWGCKAVVRLLDPKLKTLGEKGIECIFVGYDEHSNAFRFYVIEPNDSVSINSIIESRDAIFDENRFSSVPRPSLRIPNETEDISGSMVLKEVNEEVVQQPEPELRKSKRNKTPKNFRPKFQLYLIEGTRDEKEAINDEMDSIMGNNTWVLADLPPGCKSLGWKWIFKRKLKVDGTIEKFEARLVIHGFKQKSGIDYFDTYAPVARISTIRLLIAMASIHNLIIYQMDGKTTFLNGELDEEVYMNQPQGFIMHGCHF